MISPDFQSAETTLPEAILALAWSPDASRLAALDADGGLTLLDGKTAEILKSVRAHADGALAMDWSSAGIASSGIDGVIRLWSHDLEPGPSIPAHGKHWVECLRWSSDARYLLSAAGPMARVHHPDGSLLREWEHPANVTAVDWRADSGGFATAAFGISHRFRLGEEEAQEALEWPGPMISIALSPVGRFLAAGSQEGTIRFWRLPIRADSEMQMTGYPSKVRELAWDRTGRFLASGGGENVTVWDTSGKGPANTTPILLEEHASRISALAFQKAGDLLLSGDHHGGIAIWKLPQTSSLYCQELESPITCAAWAPSKEAAAAFGTSSGLLVIARP